MAGRSGGGVGENGLFVEGALTGSGKSLAVTIENGAALYLAVRRARSVRLSPRGAPSRLLAVWPDKRFELIAGPALLAEPAVAPDSAGPMPPMIV